MPFIYNQECDSNENNSFVDSAKNNNNISVPIINSHIRLVAHPSLT